MKKLLVIQTRPGIGDLCVFLPAIHAIGKNSPNYELHLLTKRRTCADEFLHNDKIIKKIIYLPDNKGLKLNIKILNILKKEKYSKCFIMHYGIRYLILSKFSGIKEVFFYGYLKKNENIVDKSQQSIKKWLKNNEIKFNSIINVNFKIKKKNQITLGIGGSGLNKKWKISNFIELAKKINEKNKTQFLIAGGPVELEDSNNIIKSLQEFNIDSISICEKKIKETIKYLADSKLYIGNDTGFMHLSGCLGVKSFGLFGDTPPNYSSYNKNIYPITPKGFENITHGSELMENINVEDVLNYI
tara:strand:- start:7919 stop:8818 length:900 start_codon:yes stop_codon:yes gene_type:complete